MFKLMVDRFSRTQNKNAQSARGTILGSLAVAQVELPQTELARAAVFFYGGLQLAANGIAPDATLPTTTAKVGLYNPDDVRSYFVDHLHIFQVSGTPAAGATLWACISNGKLGTPVAAMAAGFGVQSCSGRGQSQAKWGTAITLPAGTVWHAIGSIPQLAAANFGQGSDPWEIKGGLCIPPGYAMGLAILSGAGTTPLYAPSARHAELETDIES